MINCHPVIEEDIKSITRADVPWSRFENKKILITGANGFLPAYMVETILYLNEMTLKIPATIYALVRNREKAIRRFGSLGQRDDLKFIFQDVCDPVVLSEDIHFIIHAASSASPKYFGTDPVGTLNSNVLGTHRLLNLAMEKRCESFLFFSSGEVYGQLSSSDIPTKEDVFGYLNPADVRSCYAESKRMGETMCVAWHRQFGTPAKIVRPFHTYGPGMSLDDGRVFADFVSDIVHNRDIVMKSDGSARRAFCYLADAVVGFFMVLLKGENGKPYNIGNPDSEVSIAELANVLAGLFPEKKLKVVRKTEKGDGYLKSPITRNSPDITLAQGLGWAPKVPVAEGFERTIRSFT